MSIQEAPVTMFTDNPINWLKWAVVFAILIGGYAVAVPLYKKVSHGVSWERKRDIAKSRDHIIKASLVDKHPSGEVSRYNWRAVYRYTVADEERQYAYCRVVVHGEEREVTLPNIWNRHYTVGQQVTVYLDPETGDIWTVPNRRGVR